jgi:UrcA family protein
MAIAGLTLAAPLSAQIDGPSEPHQISVTYYDLDLTTDAGVKALNQRIIRAAQKICPYRDERMSLSRVSIARRCVSEVVVRTGDSVAQAVEAAKDRKKDYQLATR